MPEMKNHWHAWSKTLERWGLRDLTASLLESANPLTLILAQLFYFSNPLFSTRTGTLNAVANMLENPSESGAFAAFLREENLS